MSETSLGRHFGDLLRARASETMMIGGGRGKAPAVAEETAGRLLAEVTRLSIALQRQTVERESLDVGPLEPGARVLIASEARMEALLFALATWSIGAVTVHLSPDVDEELLREALERVKADWVFVDNRRTLGGLELASSEALKRANIVMLDEPPDKPVAGMVGFDKLLEVGTRHRLVGLDRLAKAIFAVPPDARAAILYWQVDGELKAAALAHGELVSALAPLPRSWGVDRTSRIFTTLPLGDRESLSLTLRILEQGVPLGFPGKTDLWRAAAEVAPHVLVTDATGLQALLAGLDQSDSALSVRGALKRGLGWLDRRRDVELPAAAGREAEEERAGIVVDQLGGWAERGLASMVKRDLGGRLRLVYCVGKPPSRDAADLLKAAGVELVEAR